VKFLFSIILSLLFFSCAGSTPEPEDDQDPKKDLPEKPPEPELPGPPENDPLEFVAPDTTSELMTEEDKKTVTGPAEVEVPEPAPDSAIDVKPPSVPAE